MTKLQEQLNSARARLEALKPDDHSEEAKLSLEHLGASCRALGLWDEALKAFDRCLQLCERKKDWAGVSGSLIWKSNVFCHSGVYGRAIELATQATSVHPTDPEKSNRMSYYLAMPHLMLGDRKSTRLNSSH